MVRKIMVLIIILVGFFFIISMDFFFIEGVSLLLFCRFFVDGGFFKTMCLVRALQCVLSFNKARPSLAALC